MHMYQAIQVYIKFNLLTFRRHFVSMMLRCSDEKLANILEVTIARKVLPYHLCLDYTNLLTSFYTLYE